MTRDRETEGNGRRVAKGLRKGDGTPGRSRSRRVPAQVIIECFQVTAVICSTIADLCLSAGLGLCRTSLKTDLSIRRLLMMTPLGGLLIAFALGQVPGESQGPG